MKEFIRKYWLIILLMAAWLALAICRLEYSDLDVDEAVEYYYSKSMTGNPGGFIETNMYQRIISTFQPPLYNVVMWFWLLFADTLWWFRLLGVLITLTGGIGIFKSAVLLTHNRTYASLATFILLSMPAVYMHALNCSEYYLMFAMLCWTIYYFLKALDDPSHRNLCLFILFSVLSVYSQYGAAIQVLILYLALGSTLLAKRYHKELKFFLCGTAAVLLLAVLPLVFFFLRFQATNMELPNIDHRFTLIQSNIFSDMWYVFTNALEFYMNGMGVGIYLLIATTAVSIITCATSRKAMDKILLASMLGTGLLYYLLLTFNYYGIKVWDYTSFGSTNSGTRYTYFMAPFFFIFNMRGVYILYRWSINKLGTRTSTIFNVLFVVGALVGFGYNSVKSILATEKVMTFRNMADFYFKEADRSIPIVTPNTYRMYTVYHLTHNPNYKSGAGEKGYDRNSLKLEFSETGTIPDYDKFYFFTREENYGDKSYNERERELLKTNGYNCDTIFFDRGRLFTFYLFLAKKNER